MKKIIMLLLLVAVIAAIAKALEAQKKVEIGIVHHEDGSEGPPNSPTTSPRVSAHPATTRAARHKAISNLIRQPFLTTYG